MGGVAWCDQRECTAWVENFLREESIPILDRKFERLFNALMSSELQCAPIISPAETINHQASEYLTGLNQRELHNGELDTVCFLLNQRTLTDEHRSALRLRANELMIATGNAPLFSEGHR